MKKLLAIMMVMALIVGIFAGCGAQEKPADEKIIIDFSMLNLSGDIDGWTAMVEAANKQLAAENIEIVISKVNGTGWPEYYQKVVSQMAAGNSPDIGRIAESYMPTLISKGQVVDLTEYIKNDFDMSQYYEKTFENSAYVDGHYYGVPSGLNNYLMYYNKDLFDEAGIPYPSADWDNPSSFEEIAEMARKLTKETENGKQFGFYTGPYMAEIGMFSTSLGGNNVFDANGNPSINDETSKQVYRWFDGMLREDQSMPRPTDTAIMSAFDMFTNGRLAMIVDGTWWLGSIGAIEGFNVGIAAVPGAEDGSAYTSQFVDSFVIYEGCENKDAGWKAIKAIVSQEGFEALAATGVGGTPVHKEVVNAVTEKLLGENVDADSKLVAQDALNHTVKVPYNEYYEEADQKVNNTMDEWLLGQITADEYADKVQQILIDYKTQAEAD
ncbi:MAG: sugar ABC transporter substrate-binding protein [Oscillospiraceae bacterium]|nr:sugar ABC transporter substrate-binding protein [Oscillospiraceae bacterium]